MFYRDLDKPKVAAILVVLGIKGRSTSGNFPLGLDTHPPRRTAAAPVGALAVHLALGWWFLS